jgi:galactokinase
VLFGVLPAAIENELVIAIRVAPDSNGKIKVANTDADYTEAEFAASREGSGEWDLAIDPKALRWESYVKAGYLVSVSSTRFTN